MTNAIEPGAALVIGGLSVVATRCLDGDWLVGTAYEVADSEGQTRLFWVGERKWYLALEKTLREVESVFLPNMIAKDRTQESHRILLEMPSDQCVPFCFQDWSELSAENAVDALVHLVGLIAEVHRSGAWLGGVERSDLYFDRTDNRFFLGAMPRLVLGGGTPIESSWRDLRLVGELAYENLMADRYPGGHEMAAMLQDRSALTDTPLSTPGLSQLLAGSLSPYGDVAYKNAQDVRRGLEQLAAELSRPIRFRVGSRSTTGNYVFRKNNQDCCGELIVRKIVGSQTMDLGFFCVADGIGGIEDGERAAGLAVSTGCAAFAQAWIAYGPDLIYHRPDYVAHHLAKVVGQRLALEGEFEPVNNRGGTTFTGLIVANDRAGVCHVGDSRLTLVRDGEVISLTSDHTLANILSVLGEGPGGSPESVELNHRTISRFLSTSSEVGAFRIDGFSAGARTRFAVDKVDVITVRRGDFFLLTTDGAHDAMDEEQIGALVSAHADDPQGLCDMIIRYSLDQMGRDNSTALAVLIE